MDNKQAIKLMKSIRNIYSWSVNCEKALDKAIASLEAWDRVIEEIDKEFKEYDNVLTDLDYSTGLGYALAVIGEHRGEIEE